MGRLTTHVLDLAGGVPAAGVELDLGRLDGGRLSRIATGCTNEDGRCDRPLLEGADLVDGVYQLEFHVGDYFGRTAGGGPPAFLDIVPVRFRISDPAQNYHVPLLISPYGYSTYRGS